MLFTGRSLTVEIRLAFFLAFRFARAVLYSSVFLSNIQRFCIQFFKG